MIGFLLNQLPGELYYWRNRKFEVDYVYRFGKKIWAVEVKSNSSKSAAGLQAFKEEFLSAELVLLNRENYQKEIEKIRDAVFNSP